MDSTIRKFEKIVSENCSQSEYSSYQTIKANYEHTFKIIHKSILDMFKKDIVNDNIFILENIEPKKMPLKIGKRRMVVFIGNFTHKGETVALFNMVETFGIYYVKDYGITKQTKNYNGGIKMGLEKTDKGIDITLPYEDANIGLFE